MTFNVFSKGETYLSEVYYTEQMYHRLIVLGKVILKD